MKMLPGRVGVAPKRSIFKRAKRGLQMYFGTGRYSVKKRAKYAQVLYARSAVRNVFIRKSAVAMQRTNKRVQKVAGMVRAKALRHGLRRLGAGYIAVYGGLAGSVYLLKKSSRKKAAAVRKAKQRKRRG